MSLRLPAKSLLSSPKHSNRGKSLDRMLIFGHTGITLGAAMLLNGALRERHRSSQEVSASSEARSDKASWLTSLGSYIDIRLLLIGSLLPDIIDKPVGQFFFRETFSHGRIFSHTLLFLILITLAGFYLYQRRNKGWLLVLSFGTFTHLILDQMWRAPQVLFWPLLGFAFERADLTDWASNIFRALLANPGVYVPELVGAAVLLWFGLVLVRRRTVCAFIRYGRVR